jgi:putative tryptophan/tyrosine transport system substrate-binding protein
VLICPGFAKIRFLGQWEFHMRRRAFITLLSGIAAAWPPPTKAQQPERRRRIGVLWPYTEADPDSQSRIASLRQALQDLGWSEGRNLQLDYRWGASADEPDRIRRYAMELVALAPDVIVAGSGGIAVELKRISRTVPIVFPTANDPVGVGLVESLQRPGGNATGFSGFESGQTEKFLELLKQIAPNVTRVAVIRNPTRGGGNANFGAIQAAALPLGVEVSPVDLRDVDAIERGVAVFAGAQNGGLVVPPAALATTHRGVIIKLAARYRLPAVYPLRVFVTDGGLMSYGPATTDLYPRVARYIDRILKGEKPGDLPVQFPTRFELFINHKTARALGLNVPAGLLALADEVIE